MTKFFRHEKKIDILVDLQFGSTGKGLLAGFLSRTGQYDTVVAANMPNAGHTFVTVDGRKMVHKALPSGIYVSDNIMIGPGAVFSPKRMREELDSVEDVLKGKRFVIHEAAGVLQDRHAVTEKATLSRISSTMQGSAAALVEKINRTEHIIARDMREELEKYDLWQYVTPQHEFIGILLESERVLVEGSQGYSLGLSAGFYPYCTSRECTAARVAADCAIPVGMIDQVFGVARCHPIRVGNTSDGFSGPVYKDQEEISWEALGVTPEKTTVTQRVRRVFTFSHQQITEAILNNSVDRIFLNFANYDEQLAVKLIEDINMICHEVGKPGSHVSLVGTGPAEQDVLYVNDFIRMVASK